MEPKDIIQIAGFVIVIGGIVWNFAFTQGKDKQVEENLNAKIDAHIKDNEKDMIRIKDINKLQWEKIDERKEWESKHEKEAWENRNSLELKISALHGADQKLEQMLLSIEKKIDRLIELKA